MFDLGWSELLVIGIVALIVVGPKDLPGMFQTLGRFTAKAKRLARDFQRAMDDAANEAGVKDAASDLKSLTNPKKLGLDAVKDAAEKFEKWEPKTSDDTPAPTTAEMTEDRAEAAKKIHDATMKKAQEKREAEAAAAQAADTPEASNDDPAQDSSGKTDA